MSEAKRMSLPAGRQGGVVDLFSHHPVTCLRQAGQEGNFKKFATISFDPFNLPQPL